MHRLLQIISLSLLLIAPVVLAQQSSSDEPQTLEAQFGYDVAQQAQAQSEPAEPEVIETLPEQEPESEAEPEATAEQDSKQEPEPESEQESDTTITSSAEADNEGLIIGEPFGPPKPAAKPIKIAHRGAPAYVPEHTAEGVAMAHAFNADFIEQDVVLTRDSVPVVLHDIRLDKISNVAKVFPQRLRPDGHFYVMDFSLDELRKLRLHERVVFRDPEPESNEDAETETKTNDNADDTQQLQSVEGSVQQLGENQPKKRQAYFENKIAEAKYPERFPLQQGRFGITTLAEQLELIHGLNQSRNKNIGVYIELNQPLAPATGLRFNGAGNERAGTSWLWR